MSSAFAFFRPTKLDKMFSTNTYSQMATFEIPLDTQVGAFL